MVPPFLVPSFVHSVDSLLQDRYGSQHLVNRRRFIGLSIGACGLGVLAERGLRRHLRRAERKGRALGSEVAMIAYHADKTTAERALTEAFTAMEELEQILSLYRPESEICRLNRDGTLVQPNPDLVTVLTGAVDWARLTNGAFDPTVQPLWMLHARDKQPNESARQAARELVDWRKLDVASERICLGQDQAITLNGIAQGFAADRVRQVFRARGIQHALVNTGEFGALGAKPDGDHWRVGIQHPRNPDAYIALAALDDRFLATSGDYATPFTGDFSSHHIFDPATGRSPAELASVTVLAPSGMEADALSTSIFVLGPGKGLELAASRPRTDALLVLKDGTVLTTPGFPKAA